jgi:hypothetical protein
MSILRRSSASWSTVCALGVGGWLVDGVLTDMSSDSYCCGGSFGSGSGSGVVVEREAVRSAIKLIKLLPIHLLFPVAVAVSVTVVITMTKSVKRSRLEWRRSRSE